MAYNFAEFLLEHGQGQSTAIIESRSEHSYTELRQAVAQVAMSIDALALPAGSRIAVIGPNSMFWVAGYLAIMARGHIAVPLATNLTPEDAERNLAWVDCRVAVADRRTARRWRAPLGDRAIIDDTVVADLGAAAPPLEVVGVEPDSDAALMFTSGTTATPKAVRVSHANLICNTESILGYLNLSSTDRMLTVLPFFYCYGASLLHTHLRQGGSLTLCNTFTYPETALEMLEEYRCTGLAGVPSSFQLLLKASTLPDIRYKSLRQIQQAGGKLASDLIDRVVAAQPQADFFVMYGQTEATSRLSYLPPAALADRRGSIGRGIPGVTLRVTDPDGVELPAGEVGEIRAAGANITKGYWHDPEGTAEKYVDGELLTGDLARRDEDGYLYVVGRRADFIKSWGYRISPVEIEACIETVPGILAVAVVGVPDSDAGEAIVAFYTVSGGETVAVDAIERECRGSLAKHMLPHEYIEIESLPLNASGKVDKRALRGLHQAGRGQFGFGGTSTADSD